jgi:hypothetical protein
MSHNVGLGAGPAGMAGPAGKTVDPGDGWTDGISGTNGKAGSTVGGGGGIAISGVDNCLLRNNLVAINYALADATGDIFGSVNSQGHNLIGRNSGGVGLVNGVAGDLVGTDASPINPLLGDLGNYGGLTQTAPLLPGSPAIDAGDDSVFNSLNTDQRGAPRLAGSHVDIGAVEGVFSSPGKLTSPVRLPGGKFSFSFTNQASATFSVYVSSDPSASSSPWSYVGPAVQSPAGSGHFTFTDSEAANSSKRFYRVSSP